MAAKFTRPRGTQDVLPAESWKWQRIEGEIYSLMHRCGYGEIRLPTFESTELFARGVGEVTDIVSKEMYTFEDKGGRSMTLRPEGTAGVVRATLENGLLASAPLPLKQYYIQSIFRYEKAQKGRYREHHQWGCECFGAASPDADAEVMLLAAGLFRALGVEQYVSLEINSIGCPACRPAYHQKLKEYFSAHKDKLCPTCLDRLDRNPMRILDCKEESCRAVAKNAPAALDNLCEECETHFADVQRILTELGAAFTVNPAIVRGLDYYTRTVFEYVAEGVGTQGTVCGGGRYDGLIGQLGGQSTPAVGFGMGIERLLLLLQEAGVELPAPKGPLVYLVALGEAGRSEVRKTAASLREKGFAAEYDIAARSVKAQMKAADRLGACYSLVLGDDEIASGWATLKAMQAQEDISVELAALEEVLAGL